jgi:predicted RNase H-like nuclease (RuvC/YqgF family)
MLTNGTVDDLRGEANQHQRRIRELEQHIQSDNRAEKLEESLKNTQERADEFEFQLSKLKQVRSLILFPAECADIPYRPMPL